jgi:hypothetical protein
MEIKQKMPTSMAAAAEPFIFIAQRMPSSVAWLEATTAMAFRFNHR